MSDDNMPDRITVLAKEFTPAAMEFHRRHMAEKGYRLEGGITPRQFQVTDGLGDPDILFDGDMYYAATFVKTAVDEA
ncbi:hypothetical protein [Pyruvatibacter mobilis]|jgi:hypothetical protein|uniref:AMP nucleosidase n=1 Tax=Pyruvatibacter mobilis TaxID=1712261 RepID=A0A845QEI1_9HYPH|nr:hypothetical protein [Pyruvatibacter mobilis]NBG96636.1 AMP nucleosidase [Pyruvatibacter mobilis]QJD74359.1 AMP nucleosidase [Pyruvatibacter mobilis]GGD06283.1 hypothetical protein GCM10011587_07760 [Pyruvatibacter mobilis]